MTSVSSSKIIDLVDEVLPKVRGKYVKRFVLNNFRNVGEHFEFPLLKECISYVFANSSIKDIYRGI